MPREVVFTPYGEQSRGLGVSGEAIQPSEVLARHGVGGNAEILIQAVRDHNPQRLVAARAKRQNFELTEKLRRGELEYAGSSKLTGVVDVAAIAGEGAAVQAVTVRGAESVCYAATDSQGTLYHGTFDLSDPAGTHISQAELLAQEGSVAAPMVQARRALAGPLAEAEKREIAAREKAVAERERALMEAEQKLAQERISLSEQAAQQDVSAIELQQGTRQAPAPAEQESSGSAPEKPAALPAGYDELDAADAAKAVNALEGDEKEQAIAYERATKGRKTVTGGD